ncbi:carboxypeptidase regulatory-like domain-containing protein [Cellulomonas composti]|uniref:Uncharacterized protein n=1 Tax=Cellulomonas composti TaxID=266130 RepID=A0A511JAP9_9CELL|nr:carboxypeptidase regulatory-like domain-containing protein [Cellulomonas composti]GEL95058.1 hypothetical protein CCO02nite_17160 [Cellulomonas composti]
MRVSSTVERLDVAPGGTGVVPLEVVNTSEVIESLSVRALGVPEANVRTEPPALALFPDASGALTLTLALPDSFPAGTYPMTLVVSGQAPGGREAFHDVELVVPPRPHVRLDATPSVVRTRGRADFAIEVRNDGNVPLDIALRATDTDRTVRTTLVPATLSLAPGSTVAATLLVKGPRQLLGSDRDRPVTVTALHEETEGSVGVVLRQRSTFSRGLITALVLLAILTLWALAFLLGMRQVLGTDPFTKVAPASFFAASDSPEAGTEATDASGAPAGALAKEGPLPAGVGGTVTGVVLGENDGEGVGRLTVVALRYNSDDELVPVASAATQADGSYTMSGLFPGSYLLRVQASGYDEAWYPAAVSEASAGTVEAVGREITDGADLVVRGHAATLSGNVQTADPQDATEIQVTARPTWNGADPTQEWSATADASGAYTFAGLPAPGTYELTFAAEGYQPTTSTERVLGGQERFALDVRLGAGTGSITGTVTDGSTPLGGVKVSTTIDGKTVEVGTPTVGQVGTFVLPNLPTPATYVLTFTKDGFGSQTVVVALGPGEARGGVSVAMVGGTGVVSGKVVDASGAGLGGVTVTLGGAQAGLSTTTLTTGDVGAFTLAGLQAGTSVTLTFTKPGFASVTRPVTIPADGPAPDVDVTLASATGSISGRVTRQVDEDGDGDLDTVGVVGATVTATDGLTPRSTTTTSNGAGGAGSYVLSDLPAGTWTVTVTLDGKVVATSIVVVTGGAAAPVDLVVG